MRGLLAAGVAIVLSGVALLVVGSAGQGGVSAGGVVFIGPIPIVFGSGQEGWPLALLSVVIGGVMLAMLLLWGHSLSRRSQV